MRFDVLSTHEVGIITRQVIIIDIPGHGHVQRSPAGQEGGGGAQVPVTGGGGNACGKKSEGSGVGPIPAADIIEQRNEWVGPGPGRSHRPARPPGRKDLLEQRFLRQRPPQGDGRNTVSLTGKERFFPHTHIGDIHPVSLFPVVTGGKDRFFPFAFRGRGRDLIQVRSNDPIDTAACFQIPVIGRQQEPFLQMVVISELKSDIGKVGIPT